MSVRADDGCRTSVEIPTKRDFLGRSLSVKIDEDDSRLSPRVELIEKPVGITKRIVRRPHEHASL